MAGNIFSGHYGRRSSAPYLDELPRVVASQTSRSSFRHESSSLFVSFNESLHAVALMRVRVGALNQYRFICEQCGRRCRILYLSTLPGCRHCTGARYRSQSESAASRRQRQAYKILATTKLSPTDFQNKKPRRHWKTHLRMLQEAERAIELIMRRNEQVMSLLRRDRSTPAGTTGK
jgi:hypothetical protein